MDLERRHRKRVEQLNSSMASKAQLASARAAEHSKQLAEVSRRAQERAAAELARRDAQLKLAASASQKRLEDERETRRQVRTTPCHAPLPFRVQCRCSESTPCHWCFSSLWSTLSRRVCILVCRQARADKAAQREGTLKANFMRLEHDKVRRQAGCGHSSNRRTHLAVHFPRVDAEAPPFAETPLSYLGRAYSVYMCLQTERQRHSEEIYHHTKQRCDNIDYVKLRADLEQQTKSRKAVNVHGQLQARGHPKSPAQQFVQAKAKTASACSLAITARRSRCFPLQVVERKAMLLQRPSDDVRSMLGVVSREPGVNLHL